MTSVSNSPGRRVAWVQGASRGLGLALVQALLRRDEDVVLVASARHATSDESLQCLRAAHPQRLRLVDVDLTDEASIATASGALASLGGRLHLLCNVAGVLHEGDVQPEKKLADVDSATMHHVFAVNAFGPLLMVKHLAPFLRHGERAVIINVSARVGSIGDNRLGGWYAYRASKAAQNMFTRNIAVELSRTAPQVLCAAWHPGTVDTALSAPFQRRLRPGQLQTPAAAAGALLSCIATLGPQQHGCFLAYDGTTIPW
ncbi:MAG: SDR family oxidoreductase [Polyangiales bacterium]